MVTLKIKPDCTPTQMLAVAVSATAAGGSAPATCQEPEVLEYDRFRDMCDDEYKLYEHRKSLLAELKPAGAFVQRLKASPRGAAYDRELKCLIPRRKLSELERRHSFDRDLLQLKLKQGRICTAEMCTLDRCGLHVRDGVVTPEEAKELVAHAQGALDTEGPAAYDHGRPYRRVPFLRSAQNGSLSGRMLSLRVAERMRRIAAQILDIPLSRIGIAETLLALRRFETPHVPLRRPTSVSSLSSSSAERPATASLADRGSKQYAHEAAASEFSDEPESQCILRTSPMPGRDPRIMDLPAMPVHSFVLQLTAPTFPPRSTRCPCWRQTTAMNASRRRFTSRRLCGSAIRVATLRVESLHSCTTTRLPGCWWSLPLDAPPSSAPAGRISMGSSRLHPARAGLTACRSW